MEDLKSIDELGSGKLRERFLAVLESNRSEDIIAMSQTIMEFLDHSVTLLDYLERETPLVNKVSDIVPQRKHLEHKKTQQDVLDSYISGGVVSQAEGFSR